MADKDCEYCDGTGVIYDKTVPHWIPLDDCMCTEEDYIK